MIADPTGEKQHMALKLPRHEKFAQEVAKSPKTGKSIAKCYEASGYSSTGNSSEVSASRLLSSPKVKHRIDEIMRPAVQKTRVTITSLLNELEQTIQDARASKQHGVVIQALTLSARLVGLLRTEIEVGRPGEFAALETAEEVLERVREELGDKVADALATALLAIDVGNDVGQQQPPR
jgi:phage terminase small subunit